MRRSRNTTGVAQLGLPGMGSPGQFSLCPNVEDWKRYEVPGSGRLEALLVEAKSRAAKGEDVATLFHRLTRQQRRLFVERLDREGLRVAPDADLVEAWRSYAQTD